MKLHILYEDNHVIAAIKPPNVLSQADSSGDADMLTIIKGYIKEKYSKPGDVYLGLVHRLDRPASGVMIFARTSKAASRLSNEIRNGRMQKVYLAVTSRIPPQDEGELTGYIKKSNGNSKICEKGEEGAKEARLKFKVLNKKDGMALIKVDLLTGRHHQIRVQFASIGCPLVGDMRYGQGEKYKLALFCSQLIVKHPTKEEMLNISSKVPDVYPFNLF
ncbi:MAG: RNA pseudouridine synthase [Eubacteriales bacterium]